MGLGAYFREKKTAWVSKNERLYNRTMKFMGMSQDNFGVVAGGYLLIGFALGLAVLFLQPLADWNPLAFVGFMMAVMLGSVAGVNLITKRAMKKAGV